MDMFHRPREIPRESRKVTELTDPADASRARCASVDSEKIPEIEEGYRAHCVKAHQQAQADFDKTVLTLSGGALGLSITFVEKIASPTTSQFKWLLLAAWAAWLLSVSAVLLSYFFSIKDLWHLIEQIDEGEKIVKKRWYAHLTVSFNVLGMVTFIFGVIAIAVFAYQNVN
ncbi:MAG: hypothetical protein AAF725_22040 [Acidobacteriota bacterium]